MNTNVLWLLYFGGLSTTSNMVALGPSILEIPSPFHTSAQLDGNCFTFFVNTTLSYDDFHFDIMHTLLFKYLVIINDLLHVISNMCMKTGIKYQCTGWYCDVYTRTAKAKP